jgi:integrase
LHIVPHLGGKRLDKLQFKDIRQWLNKLARSRKDARDTLRAALTCAVEDAIISRNPVSAVKLSNRREPRRRKRAAWTVDDARWFLESAWHAGETLYAAFVLIVVLGLRKGEVLGLTWELTDLDAGGLYDRARAGEAWIETGLVFTTHHGTPIEPRNFNRSFSRCLAAAKVPVITVHGTRKTCGSLLAALDVHPRYAMQILRHSTIAVTMAIYTEVPSAATRDALGKPAQWLDPGS